MTAHSPVVRQFFLETDDPLNTILWPSSSYTGSLSIHGTPLLRLSRVIICYEVIQGEFDCLGGPLHRVELQANARSLLRVYG